MAVRRRGALGLLALAAGAWEAQRRADRTRVRADPERAALAAPLEGRAVPVVARDGTRLHAEVFGPEDAPTVLLVHGWTCAIRFWKRQIQALSRDHRVVAYDLRGHGRSGTPASRDYSTDAFAEDLDAVLSALVPAGERVVVAGHSLGAMILVAWSGRFGEEARRRLRGAALVNTGLGDLVSEALVLRTPPGLGRVKQTAGRVALSASVPLPKGSTPVSSRAVRYVALGPSATPAQVAFCERMILECRRDVRAAYGDTLSRLELTESVASLHLPVTVVSGGRDRLTPPSHSRRLAETLPELADYVEVPEAGHMIPVEAADVLTARVRDIASWPAVSASRAGVDDAGRSTGGIG